MGNRLIVQEKNNCITIHYLCRFVLSKMSLSTLSGSNPERSLDMTWPATEKTLSDDTEVAGMERSFLAKVDMMGYCSSWALHHTRGSV